VKHIILKAAVFTGLLAFGTSVYAQNDPYYQTNRDEGWWRGHLFERVRADLIIFNKSRLKSAATNTG